jgi:Flp pilus assembly pilin Flp
MKNLFLRFVREEDGQDLVEYAFLIVFIALVAVVGLNTLGGGLSTFFTDIEGALPAPPTVPTPGS